MSSPQFSATLLRTSARGFSGLAASRLSDRESEAGIRESELEAWRGQFNTILLELAASLEDGTLEQFASKVRWMHDSFLARGMSIERLSDGLRDLASVLKGGLPAPAWSPLPPYFEAAQAVLRGEDRGSTEVANESKESSTLADAYVDQLRAGNSKAAFQLISAAIRENRLTERQVLGDVLMLALRRIGELWHSGEIDVWEEHFASHSTGRLIERILMDADLPSPSGPSVLLTMVEGDAHDLGLRIVSAHFEIEGWRTYCLGCNTPANEVLGAIAKFQPDVVVLGATLNTQRESVRQTIAEIRAVNTDVRVLVGGAAFRGCDPTAWEGADGCALDPDQAIERCRQFAAEH